MKPSAWQDAWPVPYQQHWRYGAALRALGKTPYFAAWEAQGRPLGQAVVLRRSGPFGTLTLLSRAPIWGAAPPQALATPPELLQPPHICLHTPDRPGEPRQIGAIPVMTPATVAEWSLTPTPNALRKAMRQAWRGGLAKAEGAGLVIKAETPDAQALVSLLEADRIQQRRLGYRAIPAELTAAWAGTGTGATLALSAWDSAGTCHGRCLFLLHHPVATYHIAISTEAGRASGAHALILWQAACQLRQRGYQRLDLGIIDTDRARGLARFKLGTGATARQLGASWALAPGTRLVAPLQTLAARFGHRRAALRWRSG